MPVEAAVAVDAAAEGVADDSIKRTEERLIMSHLTLAQRVLMAAVGAGAVLLATSTSAMAEPAPPPAPPLPNCTAADLTGVMAGVTTATSAYLFTHPPVNEFFTTLKDMDGDQKREAVVAYMEANPQVKAELQGIRQPAKDFRARCG